MSAPQSSEDRSRTATALWKAAYETPLTPGEKLRIAALAKEMTDRTVRSNVPRSPNAPAPVVRYGGAYSGEAYLEQRIAEDRERLRGERR
jgi:hypothetical protein